MTEIEMMQTARVYLDKMANGVDPLTDKAVAETDCLNQVRISRCLFYVSDVLGRVIESGGKMGGARKAAKQPYSADTLNTVWFGENVFGAGLASVVYFGKYAANLTAAEWALLAEIAADPEQYADVLSGGAAQDARLNPHAAAASRLADQPYYDAMIEEIIADITETKKCSRAEAFVLLYSDGVTIETPFSPEMQQAVDAVYSDPKSFADYGTVFPQSACAVLDLQGNVLAVAAGNNGNTAYNRAYRTLHPIGSSIKPISVYAPAIQRGIMQSIRRMQGLIINFF